MWKMEKPDNKFVTPHLDTAQNRTTKKLISEWSHVQFHGITTIFEWLKMGWDLKSDLKKLAVEQS